MSGRVRTSAGVLLCRRTPAGKMEALLVRKRYTYAFADFIYGRYRQGGTLHHTVASLQPLFERMTVEELLSIWSLRFGQMWAHIWVTESPSGLYHSRKLLFCQLIADGGEALRAVLQRVRVRCHALPWEVPRGHQEEGETHAPVQTAVREMEEETGIAKRHYRLIPDSYCSHVTQDRGVTYRAAYYVAIIDYALSARLQNRPALKAVQHCGEVGESAWHDLARVRLRDSESATQLAPVVKRALAVAREFMRV